MQKEREEKVGRGRPTSNRFNGSDETATAAIIMVMIEGKRERDMCMWNLKDKLDHPFEF